MLIVEKKAGGGINGEGIFDFGKILLKKALNSNLLKQASKAINSELGQTVVSAAKQAAKSDLGQALKERAISEVKKKALEVADNAFERVPDSIKEAARSELGQQLQKKIVKEVGKRSRPAEDIAKAAFARLGVSTPPPAKKRKRRGKKRGRGYPAEIVSQFGSGIVLE